ncbi:ATP-binding cassette subfamily B protein [Pedobacter sp. CG_S7]|uniref:peptidase domain-containing ABC transporter n=1 Tax=Pedobacter sp. CG_S7 TaxID=3143930 RepID=UPI0033987F99
MLQFLKNPHKFPFFKQLDAMDCGPTCLKIISKYYGKNFSLNQLRRYCFINKQGVSFAGLKEASEKLGFKALPVELTFDVLKDKINLPCILHWHKRHFVVIYRINGDRIYVADPAIGKTRYTKAEFLKYWELTSSSSKGRAILLETTAAFFDQHEFKEPKENLLILLKFVFPYRRNLLTVVITLLIGSLLTLLLPFLTQSIVDRGISTKDLSFLKIIVSAQLALVVGRILMDLIRARILFHLGTRVSIKALSDFLGKLVRLPIPFFGTRSLGDNMQRMQDNQKIELFLTSSLVNMLLSVISILVFGTVLAYYSISVFFVFLLGSMFMLLWTFFHAGERKILDYKTFVHSSESQSQLMETISAIQEIKLTDCAEQKIGQFERLQENTYKIRLASLKLDQRLQTGNQVLNELKNIIIIYLAASKVISGELTLGMMLSISYISGQLNSPILQFSEFIRTAQNAMFSLKRMNEVYAEPEEDAEVEKRENFSPSLASIKLHKISFQYGDSGSPFIFKDLSLEIPAGKTTAIVGMSGSGKTTLIKLLLKFYHPGKGNVYLGDENFNQIHANQWRKICGVVMQDGHVFADTISNNITIGNKIIDYDRLKYATEMANISSFIDELPFGFETVVGKDGHGMSEGQIQRLLIARLIYRNPQYIFLDEATNSLDANNEKVIIENLQHFFKGKTVLVVAHRLSTVKNADQIVVLNKGVILEKGNHQELIMKKAAYYNLIRNQLELGK